jgi:DNA-directed RNA polymerase III subunit RPC1
LPYEILEIVDRELATKKFTSECTAAYLATIRGYTTEHIAYRQAEVRSSWGMYEALEKEDSWDEHTDLTLGASGQRNHLLRVLGPHALLNSGGKGNRRQ